MDTTTDMGPILADQLGRLCAQFAAGAPAHDADGMAEGLWAEIASAGFQNALLPEEHGGYGVTPAQAMGLVRAAARLALPVPLAETMMALGLHAAAGGQALEGALSWSCEAGHADEARGELRVAARARAVPYGRFAAHVLVPVLCNGRLHLAPLPVAQARVEPGGNLAGEPRDTLSWTGVLVHRSAAPQIGDDGIESLQVAGAFLRAQQMVGAMQRALAHAVGHAQERKQFGQPIGRFQAVQQQLAVAAGHLAAATAAADAAAEAYGSASFGFASAVAKSRVGEAAGILAATCHQVLGAMGFTREHELQKVTRRLWAWRDEYGNETLWQERIGRSICAAGGASLWQTVVAGFPPDNRENRHG
ncbi:acyl-CoA dehydrogenase family protein [Ramlibacter sp. AN1015]|uniref:acyl-CoA dehydrogenase family protein n=1 Tax=Ramlibacter sp. AN1015 TaxID=3133428 RepID=UPI0030BCD1E3